MKFDRTRSIHLLLELCSLFGLLVILLPRSLAGQTPPSPPAPDGQNESSRDLKPVHPPENAGSVAQSSVQQSYALVVGIAHYANLPDSAQLHYPDRDAESIYTTLISQQGGQFPANHVHLLKGAEATRANLLHELEEWLPSVTT